jgi:hypothetical protein
MATIFVSHSQKDKPTIHFFLEAFAGTKVKPHFEEFEKESPSGVTADKIEQDIKQSNAVFILLSENVEHLNHTRDWVNWECGVAKNKEIWVFEPYGSLGKISIVIPHFNHYVRFEIREDWRKYLLSVIESYDDSHVFPVLSATTASTASTRTFKGGAHDEPAGTCSGHARAARRSPSHAHRWANSRRKV